MRSPAVVRMQRGQSPVRQSARKLDLGGNQGITRGAVGQRPDAKNHGPWGGMERPQGAEAARRQEVKPQPKAAAKAKKAVAKNQKPVAKTAKAPVGKTAAKPAVKAAARPSPKAAAKKAAVAKAPAKPKTPTVVKKTTAKAPAGKPSPKTPSKAVTKPAAKAPAKAAAKKAVPAKAAKKPASKVAAKPATRAPAKAAAKAVPKAAPKAAAKAAPKAVPKASSKGAAKPATQAAASTKAAAQKTTALSTKSSSPSPSAAKTPAPKSAPAKAAPGAAQPAAAGAVSPNPVAASASVPPRATRPSARLAQITVPSMPQAVASTAAKASYYQTPPPPVTSPAIVAVKKDPKLANNWKAKPADQLSDAEVLAMPDSEYMNDKQMAFFRLKLQQLKQDILTNAGETTEHLREDTVIVPDPADRATIEEENALELRTRDRERKLLKKIEQSIARIDAGDYGYCDETGEPIGVGRLLARPTATLSLEAQQRRELKQKMFGD